jgi:hypothetical protein
MHTTELDASDLKTVNRIVVIHNSDWSGDAFLRWSPVGYNIPYHAILPGEILKQIALWLQDEASAIESEAMDHCCCIKPQPSRGACLKCRKQFSQRDLNLIEVIPRYLDPDTIQPYRCFCGSRLVCPNKTPDGIYCDHAGLCQRHEHEDVDE